ncbi:MAG: MurR/RpiR family transcriptional regulator [Stackebrandtia sp.]
MTSTDADNGFNAASLSKQERRVSGFADQNPLRFATSTAAEIAEVTSTSEATVVRTAHKLGFSGTKEMKAACAARVDQSQSLGSAIRSRLASLPQDAALPEPQQTANAVLSSSADLLIRLNDSLDESAVTSTIAAIVTARRVVVYGLGTGYHIAQYLALELERVGLQALAITGSGHTIADAIPRLRHDDTLVVMAPLRIFNDIRNFSAEATRLVAATTVITQDVLPSGLDKLATRIGLPDTSTGPGSNSVAAWAICDVIVTEIARRHPEQAIERRNYMQQLRERLSPK